MFSSKLKVVSRSCRYSLFGRKESVAPVRRCARCFASEVAAQSEGEVVPQEGGKPQKNVPFAKNLYLGKFDKSMLVFPEVLEKEEVDDLNHMVQPVEKFFFEDLDSKAIDEQAKIPEEVLRTVGELGLFGQQIPIEYGGLGLNATQYARLAEITSHDAAIAVTLGAHQSIGLKGILLYGTDEQKAKYLPKLATGEHIAAFCLTESGSGSDAASVQTKATLSEDGKHYLLNGGKIYISNGGLAEIFTVFVRAEVKTPSGDVQDKMAAFIVERGFGGVTCGKPLDKLGIRGSNTCEVHFENTPVPVENVLEKVGSGFKVAVTILNSGRFSMGTSTAGSLKTLIRMVSEHAMNRKQFGQKLMEFGLIQEKIARIAINTYVCESMAYLTAGVLDSYVEADAAVEAAMVKVFSSDAAFDMAHEGIQIMGGLGYMKDLPLERGLRDARILSIFEGTNEILRLFIALTCMQHAGADLRETVKKLKDPFNNVSFLVKQSMDRITSRRHTVSPKLSLQLGNEVHPSVVEGANALEKNVIFFGSMTEKYLAKYKDQIIHQQLALQRFANISIDLYAMTAVLARATRSLSIGLRNCDHEALITRTFCFEASKRIERNLMELDVGYTENGDHQIEKIAQDIFQNHGEYLPEHPLTRNW